MEPHRTFGMENGMMEVHMSFGKGVAQHFIVKYSIHFPNFSFMGPVGGCVIVNMGIIKA